MVVVRTVLCIISVDFVYLYREWCNSTYNVWVKTFHLFQDKIGGKKTLPVCTVLLV